MPFKERNNLKLPMKKEKDASKISFSVLQYFVWFSTPVIIIAYLAYAFPYLQKYILKLNNLNLSVFKWTPMKSAGIYDPVDDSNYPYNVLDKLTPTRYAEHDNEFYPLELKHHNNQSSVR